MNWNTDTQYTEERLAKVEPGDGGWTLSFQDGGCLWCPSEQCQQAPVAGETARLYGKGFGYPVRGIVIEGRVYKYLTEAEEATEFVKEQERAMRKRAELLEAERAERDARRAALPEAFRERLATYEKRNPAWRRDFEPYELMVCETAALLAAHFDKDTVALKAFSEKSWEEQNSTIPTLPSGHSGNSWGCAISLALRFMTDPALVRGAHGALCPRVGCTEYGCPGRGLEEGGGR